MATVYKTLLNDDVTSTRTLLHEAIPITGSLLKDAAYNEQNIKTYAHGRFQSVYDYPWLSSSSNHIFDITVGLAPDSSLAGGSSQIAEKTQMYNQLSQILVGHDTTGSILQFDEDGDILAGGNKLKECVFFSFSRILVKDEIKKGSVSVVLGTAAYATPFNTTTTITDYNASNEYRTNSPSGEYGILYTDSGVTPCGLIYYQAGIMVLTSSVFGGGSTFDATNNVSTALSDTTIDSIADTVRARIGKIDFNNTVELNSTIYFCRINHNEFNYSSNPTYLQESKMRVKETSLDNPVSYITSVGLYSADNELLATAKLSEPLKKTPENEIILRVRLDY